MKTTMRPAGLIIALAAALAAQPAARAQDFVYGTVVDGVDVRIYVPGDVKVLRGYIVHVANYTMKPQDRWAEVCRTMQFGHIATSMDLKRTNRPTLMRKGIDEALRLLAARSDHPEAAHLPFAGVGHSAGGLVTGALLRTAERTLTNCLSCAWIQDPAKMPPEQAAVPALFTLGAVPDAFKMLPDIDGKFVPARKQRLPWGLAVQWHCAHDFGNSATLFVPWLQAIAEARLPRDWDPRRGPPQLKDLKEEDGWLGDRVGVEGHWATIASWKDYKGDKALATWMPNRCLAFVWRAMMSKDPPVQLTAATADGRASLGRYNPKGSFEMMIDPGADVVLGVSAGGGAALRKVEFYDGDRLLASAAAAPWQWTWKNIPQGPHVVMAVWTAADGSQGTSSPALIIRRQYDASRPVKEIDLSESAR